MTDNSMTDDEIGALQHRLANAEAIVLTMRDAIDRVTGVALTPQLAHVHTWLDWFPHDDTILNEYMDTKTAEPITTLHLLENSVRHAVVLDTKNVCYQNVSTHSSPVWAEVGSTATYTSAMLWEKNKGKAFRKIFKQTIPQ